MKNMLSLILPVSGFVFTVTALAGLINNLFGTHLGLQTGGSLVEVPADAVIVAIFFAIGAACLMPSLFKSMRANNRRAVR